jgi:hypothetical protein
VRVNRIVRDSSETDVIARWHLVSLAGVALLVALVYAPNPPKTFRAEFDPKNFPAGALSSLRQYPEARVFTPDQWGDYLIYRLYPRIRVFVDGRSDYYGDDFESKTIETVNANYDWEKTLARFGVDTVLMPPGSPLTCVLKESRQWRVVYDDGVALVFRPASQALGDRTSAATGGGSSRGREVTNTATRDREIAKLGSKT